MLIAALARPVGGGPTPPPHPTTAPLLARLSASGRAEVRIERRQTDPLTGTRRVSRARLALEPPDRARLEFGRGGERVTLRADGGEWLQPELRQMIVLDPERARRALRWSALLLDREGPRAREEPLSGDRYLVTLREGSGPEADSVWVWLGPDRLPARLVLDEGDGARTEYRLSGWRFLAARGRAAFVLEAPPGYEVVRLP